MPNKLTAIVIGAGHNGLVAALFLAKAGLSVHVLEDKPVIGGAVRTEKPFEKIPDLKASTGAYLLGLMPPELLQKMGIELKRTRRDPHYFLPTTDQRHLLFGSDEAEMKRQFLAFFSEQDWRANVAMQKELDQIREDIAPTWMEEPLSLEETAEKYVRRELRTAFLDLCKKSVGEYLDRFGFKSDLLKAMYAVTDGFSGMLGSFDTPGTGMNYLVHNMCRLPDAGGTWMIVEGGMGAVSASIAAKAQEHGAVIETGRKVASILLERGTAKGVVLDDGTTLRADVVVSNSDPFRLQNLIGRNHLPDGYNERIDNYRRDGSTLKVNLALSALPKFTCLPDRQLQGFGPTIHLLPDESVVMAKLKEGFEDVRAGKLAEFPTIEWYLHTAVDPTLCDDKGHHTAALFVQWVPYDIVGSTWEDEEAKYVNHLLSICDRFAPGTSSLVVDTFALHPQKIEKHFGITRGHIHHVDNSFGFSDRLPYETPIERLYACSAGCHPAGAVIGAAGHNAAMRVLKDLGVSA